MANRNHLFKPERSVDHLRKELGVFFDQVATEILIAFEKIEEDAGKIHDRPSPVATKTGGGSSGIWNGVLIGLGVAAFLGILIALLIYCCLRKKVDGEEMNDDVDLEDHDPHLPAPKSPRPGLSPVARSPRPRTPRRRSRSPSRGFSPSAQSPAQNISF